MSRIDKLKAKLVTKLGLGGGDMAQLDAKKERINSGSRTTVKVALVSPGVVRKEKPGNFLSAFFGLSSKEQQADDRSRFTFEPSEHLDGAKHEPTGNGSDASVWSSIDKKNQVAPGESKISKRDVKVVDECAASLGSKHASTAPTSGEHRVRQGDKEETCPRDIDSNPLQHGDRVGASKPTSPIPSVTTLPGEIQGIPPTQAHSAIIDLSRSKCGNTDVARSGANTARGGSEALATQKLELVLPESIKKEEDDDPLTYLTKLFGYTTLEDSEGSGDNCEGPISPCSKDGSCNKYYFWTPRALYSFDDQQNVYHADGTLMHNALFDFHLGVLDPNIHIDGIPYWFEGGGLWSQGTGGIPYRVQTWQPKEEPEPVQCDPYETFEGLQTSQGDMANPQSNLGHQPYSNLEPAPSIMPISHGYHSAADSTLIDEGGQGGLQAAFANLLGVELNYPASSNPGAKRKRVTGETAQLLSTKTGAVASVGGEFKYLRPSPGATRIFSATSDNEDKGNLTISPQMTLLRPQQPPRHSDPEVTPPALEKYYFHASGRRYYIDQSRKLYSEDGKLQYDGSSNFQTKATALPNFHIGEVRYWFESDGLSYQDVDGTLRRVLTWPSKQDSFDQHPPDQRPISQNDVAILQLSPSPGWFDDVKFAPTTMPASDGCFGTPDGKIDILSQNANPYPLQKGFQWGIVTQSPSSAATKSPSSTSTSDPHQPNGPSLFAATEPCVTQDSKNISPPQHATIEPQEDDEDELPAKKRRRGEPIVCPKCGKECRRPVALREHLRTHSGKKPEVCPFDKCNRGFATKSNMRRHFLTHQIGPLESYLPVYICPFEWCGENFNNQSDVIQHYLAHGIGPLGFCPPIYTCPFEKYNEECNKRFTIQQDVIQHALSHPPNRRNLPGEDEARKSAMAVVPNNLFPTPH
ncbi:hypothetical protein FRC11_004481 [Ceratobasidium sp. 423]|nr:hypothetical protein FRC11_004481 [Ceratobasidium sp. 423]